jgi:hypothetical protein
LNYCGHRPSRDKDNAEKAKTLSRAFQRRRRISILNASAAQICSAAAGQAFDNVDIRNQAQVLEAAISASSRTRQLTLRAVLRNG